MQALAVLLGSPFVFLCGYTLHPGMLIVAMSLYGLSRGMYDSNPTAAFYDVIAPRNLTEEDLPVIEKKMKELAKRDLKYRREEIDKKISDQCKSVAPRVASDGIPSKPGWTFMTRKKDGRRERLAAVRNLN